ncbi:hypothetical protein ACQR1I_35510 [Bradyrhizobium sp. HKCCYLS2038]|uniref:hypothetical protein n=1 Tax=unclassified Bradyrhizobium TaxID=2631580 RepID=UPI003EBB29F4
MLKAIFSALSRLLTAFRTIVAAPFQALGGLLGRAGPAPLGDSPEVAELKHHVRQVDRTGEIAEAAEAMARIVSMWAMDSVVADAPAPAPRPPQVSRAVADWLPGLSRDEVVLLVGAEKSAISSHIAGKTRIAGVRPVQRLTPAVWPPMMLRPMSPATEPRPILPGPRRRHCTERVAHA